MENNLRQTVTCTGFVVFILQEVERLRQLNLQAEEEKVSAVNQVRNDAKEELAKLREKLQLVST